MHLFGGLNPSAPHPKNTLMLKNVLQAVNSVSWMGGWKVSSELTETSISSHCVNLQESKSPVVDLAFQRLSYISLDCLSEVCIHQSANGSDKEYTYLQMTVSLLLLFPSVSLSCIAAQTLALCMTCLQMMADLYQGKDRAANMSAVAERSLKCNYLVGVEGRLKP